MNGQQPTNAPERFIRPIKRAMVARGLSLRQLAEQADVSPAYLSRLFNKERGVPADEVITRLENVLDIQPRGLLFDAAGRHDQVAAKVFKKEDARILMHAVASLNEAQLAQVIKVAERLAKESAP
jgi:transcriptional regulator with XRE-family HTH domain